ncbi:MAG: hypothetical protein ABIA04_14870 [Pseudomonadota bacterium]
MGNVIKLCKESGCDCSASTNGYCRFHYIKNWRRDKEREANVADIPFNVYIKQLAKNIPNFDVPIKERKKKKEGWHLSDIATVRLEDVFISFSNLISTDGEIDNYLRKLTPVN